MQGLLDGLTFCARLIDWERLINASANIATAVGFILIAWEFRLQRSLAIREATWRVFDRWWGKEVEDLRRDFYKFVNAHSEELKVLRHDKGVGLGSIQNKFPEGECRLLEITYFFDQVGWLGAHGLIDVDYLLGPMQHVLRRVYWTTHFLIENERKPVEGRWLDPVRHWGFQWLYERSEKTPQWRLVENKFPGLSLLSKHELQQLEEYIRDDESKFKAKVSLPG